MNTDKNPRDGSPEAGRTEERVDRLLACSRLKAPDDFVAGVMQRLPADIPRAVAFHFPYVRPGRALWLRATLAAAATLLIAVGLWMHALQENPETVRITFELHAPEAHQVALVGSFNQWEVGSIVLQGPDATGHWTTTLELPKGRHEYCFLVDGKQWIADPNALTRRPDGFGRENALLDI